MRAGLNSNNKKDLKPHTNTLKTNTIRVKSWRNLLLSKRTPAVIFITIGFFIAAFLPAYAVVVDTGSDMPNADDPSIDTSPMIKSDKSESVNTKNDEASNAHSPAVKSHSNYSNSTKVEINSSQTSSDSSASARSDNSSGSTLTVNGEKVDLPDSGTYRETIKTDDSTTRIRAKFDNDSNMSLRINHTNEKEVE